MHKEQKEFCEWVREAYPSFFNNRDVVDIGSKSINGDNRYLFHKCRYVGVDLSEGENVNVIGKAHIVLPLMKKKFDVVISTEMAEHCDCLEETLTAMYDCLHSGGLFLFTCASEGRKPHGTTDEDPWCSPDTNGYYHNVSVEEFTAIIKPAKFNEYFIRYDTRNFDLHVYGIKS